MAELNCSICAEKYNISNRCKVKCQYCDFVSCRSCCQTYILQETIPKCMNTECNREWTRQYLSSHFTKNFMATTFKKHQENILFDRERSLLPATQPDVERIIQIEQNKEEILELKKQIDKLESESKNNQEHKIGYGYGFI